MYVVPDEYVESTSCDSCRKFLTATPVKIYADGKIKCARCSQPFDNGVTLAEDGILQQGLFKCVNRFDGCKELLSCERVTAHEAVCKAKKHICPLCSCGEALPTYLLVKHFETEHWDCILQTRLFREPLGKLSKKICLYRSGDNLFFVKLKRMPQKLICLNAYYLGSNSCKISQTFTVFFSDEVGNFHSENKPAWAATGINNPGGLFFQLPKKLPSFVYIEFNLELDGVEVDALKNRSRPSIALPRRLQLRNSTSSEVVPGLEPGTIIFEGTAFKMHCALCKMAETNLVVFLKLCQRVYQLVCSRCRKFLSRRYPKVRMFPEWELPEKVWKAKRDLVFSCVWRDWGCLEVNPTETLHDHEQLCSLQPTLECPVFDCQCRATLPVLRMHFSIAHPGVYLHFNCVLEIPFGYYAAPFTDVFYVWAYHGFVPLEVTGDYQQFSLSFFAAKSSLGCRQKALVYDDWGQVLELVEDSRSIAIPELSKVTVVCFFELDESRVFKRVEEEEYFRNNGAGRVPAM